MKNILVTGATGLIGSEMCLFFHKKGYYIHGIDNNQRAVFFGDQGDTTWNRDRLLKTLNNITLHTIDIRNKDNVLECVKNIKPSVIIHTAAQPSHDLAASIPFDDFETNANGTLHLLEATRQYCPEATFIHFSTNKVYGDKPNTIKLKELDTRWGYDDDTYSSGISESFSIDQSKHSLFGASKLSSDILVQEYGRYFNINTCCLRGGCLTGPNHSGVQLHGFLSYLVRCNVEKIPYTVFGYKGKQVRDNIHSTDVAQFAWEFIQAPRVAEVYNIGGGKENSCSILEAFKMVENITGTPQVYSYIDQARLGDHICYYSDLTKIKAHYPNWGITISLEQCLQEIVTSWKYRFINL